MISHAAGPDGMPASLSAAVGDGPPARPASASTGAAFSDDLEMGALDAFGDLPGALRARVDRGLRPALRLPAARGVPGGVEAVEVAFPRRAAPRRPSGWTATPPPRRSPAAKDGALEAREPRGDGRGARDSSASPDACPRRESETFDDDHPVACRLPQRLGLGVLADSHQSRALSRLGNSRITARSAPSRLRARPFARRGRGNARRRPR